MEPYWIEGDGGARLAARRYTPALRRKREALVFANSWGHEGARLVRALHRLAEACAARGVLVLRFDATGMGESEGRSGAVRLETWCADLNRVARNLAYEGEGLIAWFGIRLGALTVAEALRSGLPGRRLIAWDAPPDGAAWLAQFRALDGAEEARRQAQRLARMPLLAKAPDEWLGCPMDPACAAAIGRLPGLTALPPDCRVHRMQAGGDHELRQSIAWDEAADVYRPYHWQAEDLERTADAIAGWLS